MTIAPYWAVAGSRLSDLREAVAAARRLAPAIAFEDAAHEGYVCGCVGVHDADANRIFRYFCRSALWEDGKPIVKGWSNLFCFITRTSADREADHAAIPLLSPGAPFAFSQRGAGDSRERAPGGVAIDLATESHPNAD
jgi:hypothetical protein